MRALIGGPILERAAGEARKESAAVRSKIIDRRLRPERVRNWAKDSNTLSVSRPMLVVVLKDCVTDTKETSSLSNISTSLAKSARERVSRSTL
jgi:hypothetical protein